MTIVKPDRRRLLAGVAGGAAVWFLGGCDRVFNSDSDRSILNLAEEANLRVQRLLLSSGALAPEFTEADLSPQFKANGTENPPDKDYQRLAKNGFSDWRLQIDGMVDRPTRLSLADLMSMAPRTQITRHDCVEGWSCVGKWKGVPLAALLATVGLKPQARYVVFYCADSMGGSGLEDSSDVADSSGDKNASDKPDEAAQSDEEAAPVASGPKYYESLDLVDAFHPQTILAYDMNDAPLAIAHGAPLRLRVERQLGYKHAKYLMRIELVETFAKIGEGKGGYWEDQGYDWYAGI